jgi:type VII secretion protein EccE
VLLAVVPAAMAYPWQSARERWVLGIAVAVVISLLAWWRGLHLTTMVRRRVAMLRGNTGKRSRPPADNDIRTTAVLRVAPPAGSPDVLPLPLIAGYLHRYGLRADAIRVTSRDSAAETGTPQRQTWIGLMFSATANLTALQARSPRIPLYKTAEVAVRRLGDHLRENGWDVAGAEADDIPELPGPDARETWNAVSEGRSGNVAAYRVSPDAALPEALSAIWAHPAQETWTAVEICGDGAGRTLAAGCAFRTDEQPGSAPPLAGLIPQSGVELSSLRALHPLSVRRLEGHAAVSDDVLERLDWPSAQVRTPATR